jgi:hypothetical protein
MAGLKVACRAKAFSLSVAGHEIRTFQIGRSRLAAGSAAGSPIG